ncbi:hypothetical protein ACFOEE_09545 [Pseudoalteromonas fenneropenaei]|uniref:Uncharacterized protein n=1 Tax=Pseudoalteromonas fenneropenaei TaxID=1737459 RepID=A0ABV7CJD8_9GAMM
MKNNTRNINKVIFVYFIFAFQSFANEEITVIGGTWNCIQEQKITDAITGNNSFILKFLHEGNSVKQLEKVVISDKSTNKTSALDYSLHFKSEIKNMAFTNTLADLNYIIVNDELNVFSSGVETFFPKIGEEISGKISLLDNGNLVS